MMTHTGDIPVGIAELNDGSTSRTCETADA